MEKNFSLKFDDNIYASLQEAASDEGLTEEEYIERAVRDSIIFRSRPRKAVVQALRQVQDKLAKVREPAQAGSV